MNLFAFFIQRKTLVAMLFIGLSLLGVISYNNLSVELMPDVELPYLVVSISARRDMNPVYIEREAVMPLEGAIGTLEGVSEMETRIQQRNASITISFDQNVNSNYAYLRLQEKVSEIAKSIEDDFTVRVNKVDTTQLSNMFMMLQVRGSGGLERVRAIIDNDISDDLLNVDGVTHVETIGGRVKSVEIVINEDALTALKITPGRISQLISSNNARTTYVGHAHGGGKQYFVNVEAEYTDINDLENIVVDANGPVLLKDVADITFGLKDEETISRVNGKEAVTLRLIRDANVNLIELSHATREVIDNLNNELAAQDIEIVIQSDSSEEMESNINLIKELALTGGLLSLLILWFFLRNIRLVSVVLLAIPVSVLVSFNFFYLFDISLNSLTLVGMALAIGMLLDNSVVVLENVYRNIALKKSRDEAVILGSTEVWRSITAATLTTITVFLPFVFSSDYLIRTIGRHIGISIISTLLVSLIVALILIPAAVHWLLKRSAGANAAIFSHVSRSNRPIQLYTLFLKSAMRYPARTIIGAVVLFFASILICIALSIDVSQEVELTEFSLYITMPQGATLERTDQVTQEIENLVSDIKEIEDVVANVFEDEATVTVVLKDDYEDIDDRNISQIKSDLESKVDNFRSADVTLEEPTSSSRFGGGGGANPVDRFERMFRIGAAQEKIVVRGDDFEMIRAVGEDIEYQLDDMDIISRANLSVPSNTPEIHLLFDRTLMGRSNIAINSVSTELNSFGREFNTSVMFKQDDEDYEIVIRTAGSGDEEDDDEKDQKSYDDLASLEITNSNGAAYPLETISRIVYASGLSRITRLNQEKQVEVTYRFEDEVTDSKAYLESSRAEIDELIASMSIPSGVAVELVHDESDFSEFYFMIGAAFLLIFMILASVFESLTSPFVMMFTIPLATIGALWALILTGNSILNANSLVGFLILLGVVVNNGIILIDFTRLLRDRGYRMSRALLTAGKARVRPILITTITTIVAMIPLAMGKAEYISRIGAPFAITVVGGLTLSTLFTLVFVPTTYAALETSILWFRRLPVWLQVLQALVFSALSYLIYVTVDSPVWIAVYILIAITAIPGMTWFARSSLRRADESFIPKDSPLTIHVRRLVKIYDGPGRFTREWFFGRRLKDYEDAPEFSLKESLGHFSWQLPTFAFMVYFVYFYLESDIWLVVLSHLIFFSLIVIIGHFVRGLRYLADIKGKKSYDLLATVLMGLFVWGFPLFTMFFLKMRGFKLSMVIFLGLIWYSALAIHAISYRLHTKNINIMRISGRLAGFRRTIYKLVLITPVIGKKKKPFNALNGITLDIGSGMFGLLGPNGAGKTTIMRIICGIYERNMGKVSVNEHDIAEKREELQGIIGYLPQEFGTYENMSAFEFLDYIALLNGNYDTHARESLVHYVLKSVHLEDQEDRKIGSFSGGMKQRVGIAMTMLRLPRILVVDEPTAGLDPRERIRFRNLLVELSGERIVIFSTHIIEDISSSCNRVAVFNRGELHYLGDPQQMTDRAEGKVWIFTIEEEDFSTIRKSVRVVHHMRDGKSIKIRCLADSSPWPGAEQVPPTLEDAYLWLIGTKKR